MILEIIQKLKNKTDLSLDEIKSFLSDLIKGNLDEDQIIQVLTLLRDKKESSQEILGAAQFLRSQMTSIQLQSKEAIDNCGTGGDGKNTFNISTAAAFIVAGAGIPVAKHGNRAVSSKAGSSDILQACGLNLDIPIQKMAEAVDTIGIGFLFAPYYHPALKVVAPIRQKIKTKTIFNCLGPLLSPAQVSRQVIGVYHKRLLPIFAEVLQSLGSKSAAIVHAHDGLDEITLTTKTDITFLCEGEIKTEIFDPQSVGYNYCSENDLRGGNAEENALRMKRVLKGHSMPLDHCVHLNAALAILVSGKVASFKDALLMVQESISSGKAYQKLEELIDFTQSQA